jgi:ATP-dependent protease ClpP protease subunit
MEHKYLVNRTEKEATMRLYGEIGTKVDGDYFAQEVSWLADNVDTVHIRINSPGGSILQGLSIVSAIITAKAQVITYVDGVAASMAGIVAVAGHKVVMNDFARLMIHDPYFVDENGDKVKKLEARDRRAIAAMKSILLSILKRRCSESTDVESMMKAETWLSADEAKTAGLADEITPTGRDLKNMEPLRLVAMLSSEIEKQNTGNMKQLTARLGVPEASDEQALITAVDQIENDAKTKRSKLVDTLIATARSAGKIEQANEEELRSLAESDMDAFCTRVQVTDADLEKRNNVRLSEVIAKFKTGKTNDDDHDWAWYQENDTDGLRKMRSENPEKFKALYKAYWGEEY